MIEIPLHEYLPSLAIALGASGVSGLICKYPEQILDIIDRLITPKNEDGMCRMVIDNPHVHASDMTLL